jgi:hypothetical protein
MAENELMATPQAEQNRLSAETVAAQEGHVVLRAGADMRRRLSEEAGSNNTLLGRKTKLGWICEAHPALPWPHDDCAGPGTQCRNPDCP